MSDSIDSVAPEFGTVLFVICAVVGLLLVASVVPPLTGAGYERSTGQSDGFDRIGDGTGNDGPATTDPSDDDQTENSSDEQQQSRNDSQEPASGDEQAEVNLAVTLDPAQPTPGTNVIVTVSLADTGEPVADATVTFDGSTVGTTAEDGELQAIVPFVEQLTVTASAPDSAVGAGADGSAGGRLRQSPSGTTTVETNSEIEFGIDGELGPDGSAAISATIGDRDVTLDDAKVSFNDQVVGTTDADGTAEGTLPADVNELVVTAERGSISGSETIDLDSFQASADSLFSVAGGRTTVYAAVDGIDTDGRVAVLPGAHGNISDRAELVSMLNDRGKSLSNGTTELTDGSASGIAYPLSSKATIVVTVGTHAETVVVENLYRNLAGLGLGVLSIGFGAFITYVRLLGRSPSRDLDLARDWTLDLTFSFGELLFDLGARIPLGRALSGAGSLFVAGTAGLFRSVATLRAPSLSLPSLSMSGSMPSFSLPSLSLPSLSAPSLSLGSVLTGRSADDDSSTTADVQSTPETATAAEVDETPEEIELSNRQLIWAAWREFAKTAGVRRIETATPGAVARQARRQTELPAEAIDELTEAVREIEYGGAEPTDELTERVLQAIAAVRAVGGDEE